MNPAVTNEQTSSPGTDRYATSIHFTEIAVQYYVVGRISVLKGLVPVGGNLLHHSIEMFLKAGLLKLWEEVQIKERFSHNLEKLWDAFCEQSEAPELRGYDEVIRELNRWEELRYPDYSKKLSQGKDSVLFSLPVFKSPAGIKRESRSTSYYEISLEAIDEMFKAIAEAFSRKQFFGNWSITNFIRMRLARPGIMPLYSASNNNSLIETEHGEHE